MCQSRVTQLLLLMMEFKVLGLQVQKGFSSLDTTSTYPASCIISTRNAVNAWKSRSLLSRSQRSVNVDNFSWNKYIILWLYFRTVTQYIYISIYLCIWCISLFNIVKLYVQWVDPNLSNFLAPTFGGLTSTSLGTPQKMTRMTHFSAAVLPPYAAICSGVSRFLSLLHEVSQSSAKFFGAKWIQIIKASCWMW